MPEKLLYRNARDVILALSTSRKDIDDDEAGAAVGVAETWSSVTAGSTFFAPYGMTLAGSNCGQAGCPVLRCHAQNTPLNRKEFCADGPLEHDT
jgi:hypothetical protein